MKKLLTFIAVILLAVALAGCTGGCDPKSIKVDEYADAEKYLVGNQVYTGALTEIDLDWALGSVTLIRDETATGITVTEEYANEPTDDKKVHSYYDGSALKIKFWKSGFQSIIDAKNKKLTIVYPSALSSLKIFFASGTLRMTDVKTDSAKIYLASGSCNINDMTATSTTDFEMASGVIDLEKLNTEKLTCKMASGSFTIGDCSADSFSCDMASGSTEIDFSSLKTGKLELASGLASIGIPDGGATVNLEKIAGSFHTGSELQCTVDGNKYTFGEGETQLSVKMISGGVTINKSK